MISWGNPKGFPVLLVHGREDSAATFIPLLKLLPKKYHYVGIDLAGHGKSDPFPSGVMISRFHFMLTIEYAIEHLGWRRFIYMAHSMGTELGLFYNAIHPKRVVKFVHLDPAPAVRRMFTKKFPYLYQGHYETYYENYDKFNNDTKLYTKEQAVRAVMNARGLTEEQADMILSRNLVDVGNGFYKLSWKRILKIMAPWNFTDDFYSELFSNNAPPTLVISATNYNGVYLDEITKYHAFIDKLKEKIPNFYHIVVDGSHDLHFLTPELISDDIKWFFKANFKNDSVKSKL